MLAKRLFDLFFSCFGIFMLSPVFVCIAICIRLDSPGSIFFRQERVGLNGRIFRIFKFRTMCVEAETRGKQITVGADPRITRSGVFLRRYKLDELPQLFNVLTGEMSLVGPRPEVPRYVTLYPAEIRERVLSVKPGITDYASIEYRDENDILAESPDPERAYIEEVMPAKLGYCLQYVDQRSLWVDFTLILATIRAICTRPH